eukprot:7705153-Pyramimonas_sp.AAC.1
MDQMCNAIRLKSDQGWVGQGQALTLGPNHLALEDSRAGGVHVASRLARLRQRGPPQLRR